MNWAKALMAMVLLTLLVSGCTRDIPNDYGDQRRPVDQLDERDRGLQSKDVVSASDLMARSLVSDEALRRSNAQWVMVVDRFEDHTMDRHFAVNYDIFIERLRTNISRHGRGSVTLVENKAKLNQLRNKELDGTKDDFGQGGGGGVPSRLQPDFALYGKAYDLPNRGTNYYQLQFTVVDLKSGIQVWTDQYEVKVAR
jgi:PBP1b-binding outer membrane lipoprotein LpoB